MLSNRTLACVTLGVALLLASAKSADALTLPKIEIPEITVPQVPSTNFSDSSRTTVTTRSETNVKITTNGEGTTEVTTSNLTPTQGANKESAPQQSITTQAITPTPTPWWYRLLRPTATKTPTPTPQRTSTPIPTTKPSSTPTPTPTTSSSPTNSLLDSKQQFMLNAINDYRKRFGLSSVQADKYTCDFATIRAKEIVSGFNHDGFSQRMNSKTLPYPGYSLITENIAMTSNYQNVVNMWINSPGHAANMRKDTPYVCVAYSGNFYAYEGWRP